MKKVIVLLIVVLGMAGAVSASAEEGSQFSGEARTYVVEPRDSVEKVARQFGVTVEELISANPRAVAPRNVCEGLRERTLRSGTVLHTCRRTENWFRRAGMTITIPVSRATLEAEIARLNGELVDLRAKRDRPREEHDVPRTERDAPNEADAELAEMASRPESNYNEPEQAVNPNAELAPSVLATSCPANPNHAPAAVSDDDNTSTISIATLLLAIGVILYQHYRPSKRTRQLAKQVQAEHAQVTRERIELEATRKKIAREAKEVADARRRLDKEKIELEAARREIEKQREVLVAVLSRRESAVGNREEAVAKREDEVGRRETASRSERPVGPPPRRSAPSVVPPVFLPCDKDAAKVTAQLFFLNLVITRGRQLLDKKEKDLVQREEALRQREDAVAAEVARMTERLEAAKQEGVAAKAAEFVAARAELGRQAGELRGFAERLEEKRVLLEGWEERLSERSRADDEDPTSMDGRGMGEPPPLPELDERSITDINLAAQMLARRVESVDILGVKYFRPPDGERPPASDDADAEDGDNDTTELPDPDRDRTAKTGATSSDEEIICATCGGRFPDRRSFDAHRAVKTDCRNAHPHTPTLRPPPKGKSAASTGSRLHFYCATCRHDVPLDLQDAHYAAHRAQDTLGPLPPGEGGEK